MNLRFTPIVALSALALFATVASADTTRAASESVPATNDVAGPAQERLATTPPTKPVIYNAGIGCTDGACLWIESTYLDSQPDIDIRSPATGALLGRYSGAELVSADHGSYFVYTLRLATDAELIALYTTGVEVYAVDPTYNIWSAPFTVKGK